MYKSSKNINKNNDNLLNQSDECPLISNHSDECNKDFDQDGILDYYTNDLFEDNCVAIYNPEQVDTDADGKGDVCDSDDDNDSILDKSSLVSSTADPPIFSISRCSLVVPGMGTIHGF